MTYPEYDKDLAAIYRSEVTGEALFNTAAALTFSANKAKWLTLAALERQTRLRYLDFVAEQPGAARFPAGSLLLGYGFGVLFGLMPWRAAMNMLQSGTTPLIEVFTRLDEHADENSKAFFDYVLQHELAIDAFARAELAGKPNAIEPVESLLESL